MKTESLHFKEKFSYGLGDFASNLTFSTMASYILFYFTDYAGLSIGIAGALLTITRLLDALANPFTGILFDKTHSRFGMLRPYILYSTPPIVISFIACFFTHRIPVAYRLPFAFSMYLIFAIAFSLGNGAYTSLLTTITDQEQERLECNVYKNMGMSLGGIIASSCTLLIAKKIGFSSTALLYGIISFFALFFCFKNTRERVPCKNTNLNMRESFQLMYKSKPFLVLCLLQFLIFTANITRSQSTVYYAKYILHNEALAAILLAGPTAIFFFISPFVPRLVGRFGKRNTATFSLFISIFGMIGIQLSGSNTIAVTLFDLLTGVCASLPPSIYFVQCVDAIDHAEWLTGYRMQGFITSVMMCTAKLGIVFASFLTTFILKLGGYTGNDAPTSTTLLFIRIVFMGIPIVITLLTIIVSYFYRLDKIYPKVLAQLKQRREK